MTKPTFETDTVKRYCASCTHCNNCRCEVFNRPIATDWNRCSNHSFYEPTEAAKNTVIKLKKNNRKAA